MDKCSTCQYNPQILDRLKNQLPDETEAFKGWFSTDGNRATSANA